MSVLSAWNAISEGGIGQHRQTDQYLNSPFIIQPMVLRATLKANEHESAITQVSVCFVSKTSLYMYEKITSE